MFRKLLFFLGALCMSASISLSGAAAAEHAPILKTLPNGLHVLIQQDERFPLVSLRLYVRAGSAYETPKQAGISHVLEHMVFKGTKKRQPGDVAKDIESAGGYLNASTSFDSTVYKLDLPADKLELGMDVLQDMIFGAKIDPKELESEKKVIIAELERGEDSPTGRQFKSILNHMYNGTSYQWSPIGYRERINAFTSEDIKDYIATFYQPQSMLLVLCGNISPDNALELSEKYFGDLKNDRVLTPKKPLPLPSHGGPQVEVEQGPWNKIYVLMALPVADRYSDDVPGLELLTEILGGGSSSRLYRKFKYESGLVDSIGTAVMPLAQVGMLYISAVVDPAKFDEFWPKFQKYITTFKASSFTRTELDRAIVNTEDGLYASKETIGGLTSKLGYFQFYENGLDAEKHYVSRINTVTPDEMQKLQDKYFTPDALSVSVQLPDDMKNADKVAKDIKDSVKKAWPATTAEQKKAAAKAEKAKKPESIKLGENQTLILLPDHTLPYASVNLVYKGGDTLLSPKEQGLATLTANAMARGTAEMSSTELQDFVADRASSINVNSGRTSFSISARYPIRFEKDILPVFMDILETPAFKSEEISRAITDQKTDIKRAEDQPLGLAFRHIFPFLYADSSLGYYHQGMESRIDDFNAGDMKSFLAKQKKQPWVMAVCGTYDHDAIVDMAKRIAKADKSSALEDPKPKWNGEKELKLKLEDRNQSHLMVVFPIPGSDDPDTPGLYLLRQSLAGQGGLLFRELRDKQGLGYTVTAFDWQVPNSGFLSFYIGTYPDRVPEALKGFEDMVKRLRSEQLPDEIVERSKSLLVGEYYRGHQSLSSRAIEAASLQLRHRDLSYNRDLIEKAKDITPADLKKLAEKYLVWDKAYTLTVEP